MFNSFPKSLLIEEASSHEEASWLQNAHQPESNTVRQSSYLFTLTYPLEMWLRQ